MQKISSSRLRPAEHVRAIWQVGAEPGMTPENLGDPGVWGNVAHLLNPFDTVYVLGYDGNWWAECLVWNTDKLWAKIEVLRVSTRQADAKAPEGKSGEYEVRFRGVKKWSVMRLDGNEVVKDGFQSREQAEEHLVSHLKAQAA